jgi:hypothetical protein
MDVPDRISHVSGEATCKSVKSKKNTKEICDRLATHGDFCGLHYKNPRRWVPGSPDSIAKRVLRRRKLEKEEREEKEAALRIFRWFQRQKGLHMRRRHGPALFARDLCTNDSDFFSTDALKEIATSHFISFQDTDRHVYGFDLRSLHTLIHRARLEGESANNPFTRTPLSASILARVQALVDWLHARSLPTEWAPLVPPTPEQQWRMRIVDLFTEIDSLNYYSSPDWFIGLDRRGQFRFYSELYSIWTDRAGLSSAQKAALVPQYPTRLFRHPPWALTDQSLESLQRINTNVIRVLITSAEDRNDRILGAMYVVSALTLVHETARTAYPWLYESVYDGGAPVAPAAIDLHQGLFGIRWLRDILNFRHDPMPLLRLPPPAPEEPEEPETESETDSEE